RVLAARVAAQVTDRGGGDAGHAHDTHRRHGHGQQRRALRGRTATVAGAAAGGHPQRGRRGDLLLVVEQGHRGQFAGVPEVVRRGVVAVRLVAGGLLEGRGGLLVEGHGLRLVGVGRPSRGAAVGVPLGGVVGAAVEGLRAPVPLLGPVRGEPGLLGLEPGGGVPLAADVGGADLRGDHGHLCLAGGPAGRVVEAGVVGGVVLGRVRVVGGGAVTVGGPLPGVVGARGPGAARQVAEERVGREAGGGAGRITGGVVGAVRGEVAVLGFLRAVGRVGRRGGVGSRGRGHGPRRV